jgi:bifunctional DNA-binding transcriptional regulator/antitoxin component of YhaV-PrlF toxin-antitoxin module
VSHKSEAADLSLSIQQRYNMANLLIVVGLKKMATSHDMTFSARIGEAGRLVILAKARKALNLHQGRRVMLQVRGDRLEIRGAADALKRAQAIARKHPLPDDCRLSDSLVRERHKAAARGE